MTSKILCIASLLGVTVVLNTSFTTSDWVLKKDESGIKVYTKNLSGSDVKAVKMITSANSSLAAMVSLLEDVPSYNEWVYHCTGAKIIKNISNTEYYRYQITTAPWPVENRDLITHARVIQDAKKAVTVTGNAFPTSIPEKSGLVRVKKMDETWNLIPKGNNKVDIEYQIITDPGGSVPSSVMNMFIIDGPFESMKNFTQYIHHPKYEKAKLSFIKEL